SACCFQKSTSTRPIHAQTTNSMFIDTHCHIHEPSYPHQAADVLARARNNGVGAMICVGTSEQSSLEAVAFAASHSDVFASIGVHPHDTKDGWEEIIYQPNAKIVAVGEIGLDYYYNHSPRETQ